MKIYIIIYQLEYAMEGLEWNVLHKSFHSLVASQT